MKRLPRISRERRRAEQLQAALERFERAVGDGVDAAQARIDAGRGLDDLGRVFTLATSMADTAADVTPDPAFVRRVAMQLRDANVPASATRAALRRAAPRFRLAPLAAAAAVIAAAVVLIPSFGALPGETLYAVKGAAEDARVWFARGPAEARIRLSLADERFEEVEELLANSRVVVLGGPGVQAAGIVELADISDPALAKLIEGALRDAGEQLEAAAEILTTTPAPKEDLDALVAVTTRGRALATDVADELPNPEQPPVLRAVVKLAKIEAKAKAAQMTAVVEASPSPSPCPTPAASPTPSPTPAADASPTPTPTPSPTLTPGSDGTEPAPSPTPAASSDPCATAEPTASPTPTQAPEGTDASTAPSPTSPPVEEQDPTVDAAGEGEPQDVSEEPRETHRRTLSPFGRRA